MFWGCLTAAGPAPPTRNEVMWWLVSPQLVLLSSPLIQSLPLCNYMALKAANSIGMYKRLEMIVYIRARIHEDKRQW